MTMDSAILLLDCGCINHQSYPIFDSSIVFHSNFSVHEEKDSLKVRSKVYDDFYNNTQILIK